jgi:hypothetical protein
MTKSRKRRIVKRVVLAVAGAVLLLSSYVSSYLACEWLWGRGVLSAGTYLDANER